MCSSSISNILNSEFSNFCTLNTSRLSASSSRCFASSSRWFFKSSRCVNSANRNPANAEPVNNAVIDPNTPPASQRLGASSPPRNSGVTTGGSTQGHNTPTTAPNPIFPIPAFFLGDLRHAANNGVPDNPAEQSDNQHQPNEIIQTAPSKSYTGNANRPATPYQHGPSPLPFAR